MNEIVAYNGVCPICGSTDGTIFRGEDGRFRNICRVLGCPAHYKHAPYVGYDTEDDCRHPFESNYLKDGTVTFAEYLMGPSDVEGGE